MLILGEHDFCFNDNRSGEAGTLLMSTQANIKILQDIYGWSIIVINDYRWLNFSEEEKEKFFYSTLALEEEEEQQPKPVKTGRRRKRV